MEENKHTIEEIENFIDIYFSHLNLTDKQKDQYIKFIIKTDKIEKNNFDSFEFIEKKLVDLNQFFTDKGFSKKESLTLASKAVLFCDRKELMTTLNFLIATNLIRDALLKSYLFHFKQINQLHAKKAYLSNAGNKNNNIRLIFNTPIKKFTTKFNIDYDILIKYPVTKELEQVWNYQAKLTDEQIMQEFNLTREEMSFIYPTSLDELSTLKTIAKMKDEEITEKYGITRQELLQKHPLNNDTLKALRSINQTNDKTVERAFSKTKNEVLKLRTITTEMIKIANKNVQLKRSTYTKEELSEMFKAKKKGTYPNG